MLSQLKFGSSIPARFATVSAVAFCLLGAAMGWQVNDVMRGEALTGAVSQANVLAAIAVAPNLTPNEPDQGMNVLVGLQIQRVVEARSMGLPSNWFCIWGPGRVVEFATNSRACGGPGQDASQLRLALAGQASPSFTHDPRTKAVALEVFTPVYLVGTRSPAAVLEIHFSGRSFAVAAANAAHRLWLTLGLGLIALWGLLYRLMASNSRKLRAANRALAQRGEQLQVQATKLEHLAFHDPLTHLANRTLFNTQLDSALAQRGSSAAVLLVDLDEFKTVNDSLGHAAGDELLVKVAEWLASCVRPGDTVARLGGDEFAVLLHGDDGCYPEAVAARLLESLDRTFVVRGTDVPVRASIGIAGNTAEHMSGQEVIRNADLALYEAKSRGKARYVRFEPAMHEASYGQLRLAGDIHYAVERAELSLVYQPMFATQDLEMVGVEALVRWDHPTRGRLSPDEFIPLAEQTGWIVDIGRWVLERAVAQAEAWQEAAGPARRFTMAVNVSSRQLADRNFADGVKAVLRRSTFAASHLTLEITESMLMDQVDSEVALEALVAIGARLSIDDFGTGYSSLSRLSLLPVAEVKIDRSFLADIGAGTADSIVPAIVQLSHSAGLQVVAEGVEQLEQLHFLKRCKCDIVQGYFLGRPMSAEDLGGLLAAGPVNPGADRSSRQRPGPPVAATR